MFYFMERIDAITPEKISFSVFSSSPLLNSLFFFFFFFFNVYGNPTQVKE